jgi:hypothetical protein
MVDDLVRMRDGLGREVVRPAVWSPDLGDWVAPKGYKVFEMKEMNLIGKDPERLARLFPNEAEHLTKTVGEQGQVKLMARVEVVDELEKAVRNFLGDEQMSEYLKTYDKVLGIWKGYATVLRPGFHVRNWQTNIYQNLMAGVKNPQRYIEAAEIQRMGQQLDEFILDEIVNSGRMWDIRAAYDKLVADGRLASKSFKVGELNLSYGELYKMLKDKGVVGTGRVGSDIHIFTEQELARLAPLRGTLNPFSQAFGPVRAGRKLGTMVENNARVAHFIDMLSVTKDSDAAAWSVRKYLFDYNELTDIERHVLKRFQPFHAWIRKNAELQATMGVKRPFFITTPVRTMNKLNSIDETEYTPEWVDEVGGFALPGFTQGKLNAMVNGITGLSLDETIEDPMFMAMGLPFLDLLNLNTKDQFSSISPLVKAPFEIITNYNVFYEDAIDDGSLKGAPRALQNVDQIVRESSGPSTRAAWDSLLEKWGLHYSGEKLLTGPWFTYIWQQAGPHIEAYGKALPTTDPRSLQDIINFWTGVKFVPVDEERVGYYEEKDKLDAMYDYLNRVEQLNVQVPTWGEMQPSDSSSGEAWWN